jgi:hypothetical protein
MTRFGITGGIKSRMLPENWFVWASITSILTTEAKCFSETLTAYQPVRGQPRRSNITKTPYEHVQPALTN